jgi:hypothetical protein
MERRGFSDHENPSPGALQEGFVRNQTDRCRNVATNTLGSYSHDGDQALA